MKLFVTKNIETVKQCQDYFVFSLPSVLWAKRVDKFELNFESFISSSVCGLDNLAYNPYGAAMSPPSK